MFAPGPGSRAKAIICDKASSVVAWVGLGSNVGDGQALIRTAIDLLQAHPAISVLRVSPLYRTAPWGVKNQPEFTNGVAELSVYLEPMALLEFLQEVEQELGRDASSLRWGPRTMDLDILMLDDRILYWPGLTVPHPRMHTRVFVLAPLFDLAPNLIIPGKGAVRRFLARQDSKGIQRIVAINPNEN